MDPSPIGHYFDEFEAGQIIRHAASKTIFECDNNFFSLMTMNHHPLHTNRVFAENSQHGQIRGRNLGFQSCGGNDGSGYQREGHCQP